jgi:hypothetical protein
MPVCRSYSVLSTISLTMCSIMTSLLKIRTMSTLTNLTLQYVSSRIPRCQRRGGFQRGVSALSYISLLNICLAGARHTFIFHYTLLMRVSSAFQGMIQVLRTGSLNGTLGLV